MQRIFAETPGGQIHYRMEGSGEPLLLIHQVPCSSAEFLEVIPRLSIYGKVLAIDLPPYGDSYKPIKELQIEDLGKIVLQFLDNLSIKQANIVGHHTGACVAAEIAAERPDRVKKLVLSGCPSWSQEESLAWLNNPNYRPLEITPDGWFLKHIWRFTTERIPSDQMEKAYELALEYMKAGTQSEDGHRAAFKYRILPKLERIKAPTLALCGSKDVLFKFHDATLKRIPHAQSFIIEDGNVQTPRLLPDQWAHAIAEFLKA